MWIYNKIFKEDLDYINAVDFIDWNVLAGKTIFITGATGLIGFNLVSALLYVNRVRNLNLKVLALARNEERARARFTEQLKNANDLHFVIGDVESFNFPEEKIDYIIHGASQTGRKAFVEQPVETIFTALHGTERMLKLAKEKNVKGFAYLSSMEVYGYPPKGHKVREDEIGSMSPLNLRNSYPISKVQCESLCCAYAAEYKLPAMIVRLTQTFGAGVNYNDNRIFAEFARCIIEKKDIILKTKGETERCYLYTADAVTAILTILLKGENGRAYNAGDESSYCSIAEMAEEIAKNGNIKVRYELQDEAVCGYPQTLYMDLDVQSLRNLGWRTGSSINEHTTNWGGFASLISMYNRMIKLIN